MVQMCPKVTLFLPLWNGELFVSVGRWSAFFKLNYWVSRNINACKHWWRMQLSHTVTSRQNLAYFLTLVWSNPSWKLTAKLCLAEVRLQDCKVLGLCGACTLTCLLGLTRGHSETQPINSLCDAGKHGWHTPFSPTVTCRQSLAFNFHFGFDQLAVTRMYGPHTLT